MLPSGPTYLYVVFVLPILHSRPGQKSGEARIEQDPRERMQRHSLQGNDGTWAN